MTDERSSSKVSPSLSVSSPSAKFAKGLPWKVWPIVEDGLFLRSRYFWSQNNLMLAHVLYGVGLLFHSVTWSSYTFVFSINVMNFWSNWLVVKAVLLATAISLHSSKRRNNFTIGVV